MQRGRKKDKSQERKANQIEGDFKYNKPNHTLLQHFKSKKSRLLKLRSGFHFYSGKYFETKEVKNINSFISAF